MSMRQQISRVFAILLCAVSYASCCCSRSNAMASKPPGDLHQYGQYVSYQLGQSIEFPDVKVIYLEDVLEPGHEKITSQKFELQCADAQKTVLVGLPQFTAVVLCEWSFYVLDANPGFKTLTIRKGICAALRAVFWLE